MAGDWIKFEKSTLEKPEVYEIAGILGIDPDAVVGKLLRVWNWYDDQSVNGDAPVTLAASLNRHAGVSGFVEAMQVVGWITIVGDRLVLPNFSRHNGKSAKRRALGNVRNEVYRKSDAKTNAPSVTNSVTNASPEKRIKEKRLEDSINGSPPLCTIDQAKTYAPSVRFTEAEAEKWWHTRNASGWTKGSANGGNARPITSWQSDMATSSSWVKQASGYGAKAKSQNFAGIVENLEIPV